MAMSTRGTRPLGASSTQAVLGAAGPARLADPRHRDGATRATPEDAEDACQRGLEILLTKAPTTSEDELIPWLKTMVIRTTRPQDVRCQLEP